ncbi:hypothetical protein ACFL1Z_02990, partial [Thermodesulfobacteriota bacterium]
MIENIPSYLMVLDGESAAEFGEAIAAIQCAITAWNSGDNHYKLEKIPGRGKLHPFTLLRKHLIDLKDEGIQPETTELNFITDPDLRQLLRLDISIVNKALENGEWKAATVLGGSIIEALLLWKIQENETTNTGSAKKAIQSLKLDGTFKKSPSKDKNEWTLYHLIEVSAIIGLIKKETADQCRIAKDFRNLIHPGRAKRLAINCDRGTALSSVAAIEHVIRNFS